MKLFYCVGKTWVGMADKYKVSSPIHALANPLQQIFSQTLQNSDPAPGTQAADSNQLSPLAQVLHTLQQLQLNDPAKYKEITGQIATSLQNAPQSAQEQGNTTLADQFARASQTGQLPDIQDLAQAIGGHHHHRHHAAAVGGDATASAAPPGHSSPDALSVITTALRTGGL
jgi:hypothetical protein